MNAIMNKNTHDISGSSLYTTHFPCNECAKLIIQARIREVIYLNHKKPQDPIYVASTMLLDTAGVKHRKFLGERESVLIRLA